MFFLLLFVGLLILSMNIALIDWRRGWLMALLCGALQDPVRKMTPGTPVVLTMSVIAVYLCVLFAGSSQLQLHAKEFSKRFGTIYGPFLVTMLFVALAAIRGVFTYGIAGWKAPALSLFIYLAPIPAVLLGYAYLQREELLLTFLRFYAIVTSIALIGTPLEYFDFKSAALGTVALTEYNIRYLPGIQIRMLSGLYRAPDIMGWHAATLTIVGIVMALRRQTFRGAWPWLLVTGWGMLNCLLSGRRKAVYMVAVFAGTFLWRYFRRLTVTQAIALVLVVLMVGGVVYKISQDEASSVYARGTATSREEIFERLEGGLWATIDQFGILGAGLGSATQGVHHFHLVEGGTVGWQEGGLGKLAIELGVPGLLAVLFLGLALFRLMFQISGHPDVPGSPQLIRAALFAIVVANVVEFLVSAQAYSDPVLTLMTAFFVGTLLATAVLDERLAAAAPAAQALPKPATA